LLVRSHTVRSYHCFSSLLYAMARFLEVFAILVFLVPQFTAAACLEGACAKEHDDVTSLIQVKNLVKTGGERDSSSRRPKSSPMDEADVDAERDAERDAEDDEVEGVDDPDVEEREAPIDAYDNARERNYDSTVDALETHELNDQAIRDRALEFDGSLRSQIHEKQEDFVDQAVDDQASVDERLAEHRDVLRDSIHQVVHAQDQYYDEAALARATKVATLEGESVGRRIGLEHAREVIGDMRATKVREHLLDDAAQQRELDAMELQERMDAKRDAESGYEADGERFADHVADELDYAKEDSANNAELERDSIAGVEGVEDDAIEHQTKFEVDGLDHAAEDAHEDMDRAVADGADEVRADYIADAVTDGSP